MESKGKYYLTTAIAYTSAKPISVITTRSYWLTALHVSREKKVMMFSSRPVPMSTVRRSN